MSEEKDTSAREALGHSRNTQLNGLQECAAYDAVAALQRDQAARVIGALSAKVVRLDRAAAKKAHEAIAISLVSKYAQEALVNFREAANIIIARTEKRGIYGAFRRKTQFWRPFSSEHRLDFETGGTENTYLAVTGEPISPAASRVVKYSSLIDGRHFEAESSGPKAGVTSISLAGAVLAKMNSAFSEATVVEPERAINSVHELQRLAWVMDLLKKRASE